jgi:putative endonuclease
VKYVYILACEKGEHFYVGVTDDVLARLAVHNSGHVTHTAKYMPWKLRTYIAFSEDERAFALERYLKSGSGRAFASKRF